MRGKEALSRFLRGCGGAAEPALLRKAMAGGGRDGRRALGCPSWACLLGRIMGRRLDGGEPLFLVLPLPL